MVVQPWMPRAARASDACLWHVSRVGSARRRGCAAAGVSVFLDGPPGVGCQSGGAMSRWTVWVPVLGVLMLAATWGSHPGTLVLVPAGVLLGAAVLAAVHHAE